MSSSKTPIPPIVPSPSIIPDLPEVDWDNIAAHPVKKRSVVINGHKTSLSIEAPYWSLLLNCAASREIAVSRIVEMIDDKATKNLSSAVRLYLLDCRRAEIQELLATIKQQETRIARLKQQNAKLRGIADIDTEDGEEMHT